MNITNTRKALALIANTFDTTKSTTPLVAFPERKPGFSPNDTRFFERVTPEECGIDSNTVKEFTEALVSNPKVALHGIMLLRNGKVFFEADVGTQSAQLPKATFSQCKSVVSLAIGMLITEGKLKLSEKIVDIFPMPLIAGAKIRLKDLTVKHLLTMTSAVSFNEVQAMTTSNWVKSFLNSTLDGQIGKDFRYNSLNTYMLSAIIKEKTGMGLSEYLDSSLFKELGITDYYWEKCPDGIEKGGWGLYIRREDMAKIGQLVMQKGIWQGKRLIKEKYIEQAVTEKAEAPAQFGDFNYGYHIWCGRAEKSFLFNGMFGQNLLGYSDNGVMIVSNSGNGDCFQQNDFFAIANSYFNKQFPDSIRENKSAHEELLDYACALKQKPQKKSLIPIYKTVRDTKKDIDAINGKAFSVIGTNAVSTGFAPLMLQLIQANYTKGLNTVSFKDLGNGSLLMRFEEQDATHDITVGLSQPITNKIMLNDEPYIVTAHGELGSNEEGVGVLTVNCDFIETPYSRTFKFILDPDDYSAVFSEAPGTAFAKNAVDILKSLSPDIGKLENAISRFDRDYLSVKLEKAVLIKLSLKQI